MPSRNTSFIERKPVEGTETTPQIVQRPVIIGFIERKPVEGTETAR